MRDDKLRIGMNASVQWISLPTEISRTYSFQVEDTRFSASFRLAGKP